MTNAESDYSSEQNAITQSVGTDDVLSAARLLNEVTYSESSSVNSRTNWKSEAADTSEIVFTSPYDNRSTPSENSARAREAFSILSPRDLLAALRSASVPPETTTREGLINRAERIHERGLKLIEETRVTTGLSKDELERLGFSDKEANDRLERERKTIATLTDTDLKNIDAFLTAAKKNDVNAMKEK
ncbi:MAG: hypothetical protein K2W95_01505 [Candidatus Obscuribacterales bacterium]|nr:hypothetical protein [Candidatus Obscuribacterales bacterium]